MSTVHVMGPPEGQADEDVVDCTDPLAPVAMVVFHPNARQLLSGVWFCDDCGEHSGEEQ